MKKHSAYCGIVFTRQGSNRPVQRGVLASCNAF